VSHRAVAVGEISEQIRGVSYGKGDATDALIDGYLPVLRAGNITEFGVTYEDLVFVPKHLVSDKQLLRSGDVLIAASSGSIEVVGKAAPMLNDYEGAFGAFCKVLRPRKSHVEPSYFAHYFKTNEYRRKVSSLAAGANINNLKNEHLDDLLIPLPPLPEQRRIAAILDKADALRTKRREALAQLDRLAQSIFVEMFGDLFTNSKGFPVARLGDACDVRDGTHDSPAYVAQGYPLVTSKNLRDGKIDLSTVNFISEADYNEINRRSKVGIGDILMPMIGTIGNPVLVEEEPLFAIKNMALIKFKLNSPCREFVLQFLRSDFFDRLVASKNKGGTQKFLALGEIRGLPLPVPSESSQVEFSKRIHAINRKRTRYEDALDGTDRLFASLQHRAFRGEL
jgi:type I restriction enzyme S subunit